MTYGGTVNHVSVGHPDLKPETGNSNEVGARFGDSERGLEDTDADTYLNSVPPLRGVPGVG